MRDGHPPYTITLDRYTSSAKVLDIICQVSRKTWADDATVAGLVHALDDLLAPQATLCSSGQDKRITSRALRRRIDAWHRRAMAS